MPPVNLDCLDDDYQDARVFSRGENFIELEVIHYPLNTSAEAIGSNPAWRRDAESKQEYLRPGITTNWDDAMRRDLIAALGSDGIDPEQLDDKELVSRASAWLLANSKYVNMFCTHYMHFPKGRAAIYPGLEARFQQEKGDPAWTVQQQLDHELFGRSMFAHRTHGSCTSSAVFLTTALRALGIPTRMVLGIPLVDGNDPEQLAMVRTGIHHHRLRGILLQGLSGAKGYANHTFNEVFIGGRWVRLNYKTLGQNTLDGNLMGMLTHVNTFNDLSEVPLAATWGKRYAKGERDEVFRYRQSVSMRRGSDHFGKFAKIENPESARAPVAHDQQSLLGRRPRSSRHDQRHEVVGPQRRFGQAPAPRRGVDRRRTRATVQDLPRGRGQGVPVARPRATRMSMGGSRPARSSGTHATTTRSIIVPSRRRNTPRWSRTSSTRSARGTGCPAMSGRPRGE